MWPYVVSGCFTLCYVMLSVGVATVGAWTVLRVTGEVDMSTGPQLRQTLVSTISEGNAWLVVDLGQVDFIDSTGLGILIGGLKRARSQGGDLKVMGVHGHVHRVFELTGLGEVLAPIASIADLPTPSTSTEHQGATQ